MSKSRIPERGRESGATAYAREQHTQQRQRAYEAEKKSERETRVKARQYQRAFNIRNDATKREGRRGDKAEETKQKNNYL